MIIQTQEMQLRHFVASDLAVVYQVGCEREIVEQLNMPPFQSEHEAQSFLTMLQSDEHSWAIVTKETDAVCGLIMLAPNLAQDNINIESYELSFAILPQYRRQGLMTSALSAVLEAYHDNLQVSKFMAACFMTNQKSALCLQKVGFTTAYQTRLPGYLGGDLVQYYQYNLDEKKFR
ncbi:GNAT family N-acetyltransferase [Latilactobacillus sakei]|uniref:GNAT family N-acetyltransferase n=1 Tax=Latilactobacillus sakei TaxID=1599 RepID=UPI003F529330